MMTKCFCKYPKMTHFVNLRTWLLCTVNSRILYEHLDCLWATVRPLRLEGAMEIILTESSFSRKRNRSIGWFAQIKQSVNTRASIVQKAHLRCSWNQSALLVNFLIETDINPRHVTFSRRGEAKQSSWSLVVFCIYLLHTVSHSLGVDPLINKQ